MGPPAAGWVGGAGSGDPAEEGAAYEAGDGGAEGLEGEDQGLGVGREGAVGVVEGDEALLVAGEVAEVMAPVMDRVAEVAAGYGAPGVAAEVEVIGGRQGREGGSGEEGVGAADEEGEGLAALGHRVALADDGPEPAASGRDLFHVVGAGDQGPALEGRRLEAVGALQEERREGVRVGLGRELRGCQRLGRRGRDECRSGAAGLGGFGRAVVTGGRIRGGGGRGATLRLDLHWSHISFAGQARVRCELARAVGGPAGAARRVSIPPPYRGFSGLSRHVAALSIPTLWGAFETCPQDVVYTSSMPARIKRVAGTIAEGAAVPETPAEERALEFVVEGSEDLDALVPEAFSRLAAANEQRTPPAIAKDRELVLMAESALAGYSTRHRLVLQDCRQMEAVADESVHLVVTSPPYWTLKEYPGADGQLGHIADYEEFLEDLDDVWRHAYRALVPGGRLVIVVGDVCLSRRVFGRHMVVPLHASIQEHCRTLGFDNLAPIIWHKIANARFEVENGGGGFLGKPYEPNAVIKNDVEFILFQRKPGGYRQPSLASRLLSVIPEERHREWFRQVWTLRGASTRRHPAPYPLELAERLVRMFSFAGDTVLDPFAGTGTTCLAARRWGRHSIGYEIEPEYFELAASRLREHQASLRFTG